MIKCKLLVRLLTSYIVCSVSLKSLAEANKQNHVNANALCKIQCPPGSEPLCSNTSQTCVSCRFGSFSKGRSQHCQQCQNCPRGYGATSRCTSTNDILCEKCTHGKSYSDTNNGWPCFRCSDCITSVSSPCNIYNDTKCSLDTKCPFGKYRDAASESCLYCSEETEGSVRIQDCQIQGIPQKYQFSYNPFDPRPYSASATPTPDYLQAHVTSKVTSLSGSNSNLIAVTVVVSVFGAIIVVILGALIVCYCTQKTRSVLMQRLESFPMEIGEEGDNNRITVDLNFPLKKLPRKTKLSLCTEFMQRGPTRVNYLDLATFTQEEKNQLNLCCQTATIDNFTDKLFEFLEIKTPDLTVNHLIQKFVEIGRQDFEELLKTWLLRDNHILDLRTTAIEPDLDTPEQGMISAPESASPRPSSPSESLISLTIEQ